MRCSARLSRSGATTRSGATNGRTSKAPGQNCAAASSGPRALRWSARNCSPPPARSRPPCCSTGSPDVRSTSSSPSAIPAARSRRAGRSRSGPATRSRSPGFTNGSWTRTASTRRRAASGPAKTSSRSSTDGSRSMRENRVHVIAVPKEADPRASIWAAFADVVGFDASVFAPDVARCSQPSLGTTEVAVLRGVNEAIDGRIEGQLRRTVVKRYFADRVLGDTCRSAHCHASRAVRRPAGPGRGLAEEDRQRRVRRPRGARRPAAQQAEEARSSLPTTCRPRTASAPRPTRWPTCWSRWPACASTTNSSRSATPNWSGKRKKLQRKLAQSEASD